MTTPAERAPRGELIRILLAEDNPDDVLIMKKAFRESGIINQLFVVRDGEEALEFLRHEGRYQDPTTSPTPGLILLDINMPKLNGLEVLERVKQDPALRRIPAVMLTSSRRGEDVIKSYENGCNSFLQKPVEFERFVEMVKQLGLYWGLFNIGLPEG